MKQLLLLLLLTPLSLAAQPEATLVRDINPGAASSRTPAPGVAFRDRLFFPATTAAAGTELWVSDGTNAGTTLFAEIVPGTGGGNPANLIVVGDFLYFSADGPGSGRELYRTDGTTTELVADILPGAGSGIPDEESSRAFGSWNGILFFAAQDAASNVELWRSGGTAGTTAEVRDLSFSGSSFPQNITAGGDVLYFTADNGSAGDELWKTTGTFSSTQLVADLNGGFSSDPFGLTMRNDTLFFAATNGFASADFYRTDGTAAGTQLVANLPGAGLNVSTNASTPRIRLLGDNFIFAANGGTGPDLWISDGTAAGTRVLLDTEEAGFGGYTPQNLTIAGDLLYYKDEIPGTGVELWRTDGTTAGTVLTKELDEGFFSSFFLPSFLHGHLGQLYFGADGDVEDGFGSTGVELYASNGSAAGTGLLTDINAGSNDAEPNNFVSVGELLFFFADDGTTGQELYVLEPAPPAFELVSITPAPTSCAGGDDGSIRIILTGGTPPYFGGDNTSGDTTLTGFAAGTFNLILRDAAGVSINAQVTVTQPSPIFADPFVTRQNTVDGGSIALAPTGGTPPYVFAWADTSLTTNIREDLAFGDYTVTITDANGCAFTDTYTVDDETSTTLLAPGSFRLYPTLTSDRLTIEMANGRTVERVSCLDLNGRVLATAFGNGRATLTLGEGFIPGTNGTYVVSILTTDGRRGAGRIVVAR